MLDHLTPIPFTDIPLHVSVLRQEGYRLVTATCVDTGAGHEITYHFDKAYQLRHLRVELKPGNILPSISHVFFTALIVENEIKDMFGVQVSNMAIDFQGRFLLTEKAPKAPMNKKPYGIDIDVRTQPPATPGNA